MKILITGDTHGSFTHLSQYFTKFDTTKNDICIILGDAGINYYVKSYMSEDDMKKYKISPRIKYICEYLTEQPITFFCIHGNHEARPASIKEYIKTERFGGQVYINPSYPSIIFAKDGEVYTINGKRFLVIGGAYSVDKYYRLSNGYAWFDDEQPSQDFMNEELMKNHGHINYVLTHTCPQKYIPYEAFISGIDQSLVDNSTEKFLNKIENKISYDKWYCGHYHINKKIDKVQFMFNDLEILDSE